MCLQSKVLPTFLVITYNSLSLVPIRFNINRSALTRYWKCEVFDIHMSSTFCRLACISHQKAPLVVLKQRCSLVLWDAHVLQYRSNVQNNLSSFTRCYKFGFCGWQGYRCLDSCLVVDTSIVSFISVFRKIRDKRMLHYTKPIGPDCLRAY